MNMHGEWQLHYVSAIDDNTIKELSLYAGEFLLVEIMRHRERECPCVETMLGNMYRS
jgi:hypothetical protein